ncbi:hypothetical protein PR202_gb08955 [Eleusine coracana subsp. coracana]|uniref:NAC domain-containing protein n=1 Tax=Eleusine coracana subsp. coracana TaxID=191504 RepID=A0AAV5EG05_ELECO|nr:hypothetical protein PR202_gb08955 [Eleusine coracana subsp. coracana]
MDNKRCFFCCRYWLTNGRGIAKKIRYATHCADRQISELGAEARRECPNCKHYIDNSDVAILWPGLPAGVKFDPSDLQLLQHLESKIGLGGLEPHVLIDEFIATVENDEGICYSHPENLPGMKKDGSIVHFFHRVSKAYGCGQRKRRRVTAFSDHTVSDEHLRWHKTGKTKPIYDNGVTKGWKKILVLYRTTQKGGKSERAPWVMHQYHLGEEEEEKDGDLVVSKVFYQLSAKHMENAEIETGGEEPDAFAAGIGPKTPKTSTPQPRRTNNSPYETEQSASILLDQDEELTIPIDGPDDGAGNPAWCTGELQAVGEASRAQPSSDDSLLCLEDPASLNDETLLPLDYPILSQCRNEMLDGFYGLADLNNVDLGTLPDLQLSQDIQFGSQESIGSWLDHI